MDTLKQFNFPATGDNLLSPDLMSMQFILPLQFPSIHFFWFFLYSKEISWEEGGDDSLNI